MDRSRHDESGGGERVAGVAAALAGTVAVFLWLGGQVAALITHGRWPGGSSPLQVAGASLHGPAALRLAWPPSQRRFLPPDLIIVAIGTVLLGVVAAIVVASVVTIRRLTSLGHGAGAGLPNPADRVAGSGWARGSSIRALELRDVQPGRLTLGRRGEWSGRRRLLAAEARASVIVLGPTQSGKTSGLAIPAILEWEGPVLATSVKTDLARHTLAWRQRAGETWVYDPTASTGLIGATWSPLVACGEWDGARRTAAWLCGAARGRGGGTGDDDFWYATAAKLLAPHLLAAARAGAHMGDVVRWIDTQDEEEVAALLDLAGVPEASAAMAASWGRDERTRSSVYTTAETVLDAFGDRAVARSTMTSDIQVERLLGGEKATLYICAPGHEQERLTPLFTALLQHVFAAAYDRSVVTGRPLDPPLLVVLDEAANIAPLRDLDRIASTAASHGIQLVTVWQDLAQIQARYGPRAATVVNNHRAKIVLSGISDPPTLDYVSRLLGDGEVRDASVTTDGRGGQSTTRARRERRLLTEAELRRIQPQHGVLVYGHLPPVRMRLRPWFTDPALRGQAQAAPGALGPDTTPLDTHRLAAPRTSGCASVASIPEVVALAQSRSTFGATRPAVGRTCWPEADAGETRGVDG